MGQEESGPKQSRGHVPESFAQGSLKHMFIYVYIYIFFYVTLQMHQMRFHDGSEVGFHMLSHVCACACSF